MVGIGHDWSAPVDEGRADARHKLAAAVKMPRNSVLPAVEMAWLAGLPDDELEACILEYLRAVALLCDLAQIDTAIQEMNPLLPKSSLSEALKARGRIHQLTERMNRSLAALDILDLRASIEECQREGWPPEALQPAITTKQVIEDLLARLLKATKDTDIQQLDAIIHECEDFGLPDRDLHDARAKREEWENLLLSLQTAVAEKDLDKLNDAIRAGQALCVKLDTLQ